MEQINPEEQQHPLPILQEITDADGMGKYASFCKWFGSGSRFSTTSSYNYGFLTIVHGPLKGRDVFVHHTGIRPLSSRFRILSKGEYVQHDIIVNSDGQFQAVNVTGIGGGPLMCDITPSRRFGS